MSLISPVAIAVVVLFAPVSAQQAHEHGGAEKLGTVRFRRRAAPRRSRRFARAMALLHSFEFAPAIEGFTAAGTADPGCAIAYWGIALSRWGNPFAAGIKTPAQLEAGRAAIAKARTIGAKTDRERDYIAAAGRLFADFEKVDQRTRLLAYRDAMADLAARYADDPEASAFYALALAASNDPTDQTYASLLKAGAILERLAPTQPDHPGFVHYIIHAYDVPPLAPKAVEAARSYAKIAPSAPHALHMPSHTFTRLGYWQDSIDTNIASARGRAAGGCDGRRAARDGLSDVCLSADGAGSARRGGLVDALPGDRQLDSIPSRGGSAAPPIGRRRSRSRRFPRATRSSVRRGLRRRSSSSGPAASRRPTRSPGSRAASARRAPEIWQTARAAIDALQQLEAQLAKAGESYWAEQVAIQRLGVSAWTAFKDGRTDEAIDDDAKRRRPRGPDREECGHAWTDCPGARAPRLHADRGRSARPMPSRRSRSR